MCARWTATLLQFCICNLFLKLQDKILFNSLYGKVGIYCILGNFWGKNFSLCSRISYNLENWTTQKFLYGKKYLDKGRTSLKIYSRKVSKWRILEKIVPQKFANTHMMPYLRNKEVFIYSTIQLQWYILHSLFNIMTFILTDFNYCNG